MFPHFNIASIPADGIGPEVIAAGIEVLEVVCARNPENQLSLPTVSLTIINSMAK